MWPEGGTKAARSRALRVRRAGLAGRGGRGCYLDGVLQLGVLVVEDAEAEWLLGDHFHEHEVATLSGGRARQVSTRGREGDGDSSPCPQPTCRPTGM